MRKNTYKFKNKSPQNLFDSDGFPPDLALTKFSSTTATMK